MNQKYIYDVIVIGAGAAGLMAASVAGQRGRKVLLLEHTDKIGEKIRISGGGRCNFTNLHASPNNYLSSNPHFIKSPLSRYSQHDFIKLVESYGISYHEKTLGQLFCDQSSSQIISMLMEECNNGLVKIITNCQITNLSKSEHFSLSTNCGDFTSQSIIIATGGLSIPKIGASPFGYDIARQFGHDIIPTRPGLVPLTVSGDDLAFYKNLSGISINSVANFAKTSFAENILFTHRGLSGPAILQISSYLPDFNQQVISLNLSPELQLLEILQSQHNGKISLPNLLKNYFPNRFVENWCERNQIGSKKIAEYSAKSLQQIAQQFHDFKVKITGSEGYLKAEVTCGGVDTRQLSSKTMESTKVPGLFLIGEVVDVTGWLGGYNFQWAWSSAHSAGNYA